MRHAFADVDGIRLHWAELGERSSHPPLVLQSFADCGHYVHRDQPAAFVAATRAFLDEPRLQPARLLQRRTGAELGSHAAAATIADVRRAHASQTGSPRPLTRAVHALSTLRARLQRRARRAPPAAGPGEDARSEQRR